jgi:hypothetical protein
MTEAIAHGAMRSHRVADVGFLARVVAFLATPPGAAAGTTERVSVDSVGTSGNGELRSRG